MDNPNLYEKGTIFVAPGGGGAPTPLEPGADGYALIRNDSADLGVEWAATVPGDGDVVGPGVAVDNTIPRFNGTTGKLIQASNVAISDANVQTFPAGAGVVLTAGATASERKGQFTLSSGTHAKIL